MRYKLLFVLLTSAALLYGQNWHSESLGQATFELPARADTQFSPPNTRIMTCQSDSLGQFVVLFSLLPDDMAAQAEQGNQNLQGIYGWMNNQINRFFGFDAYSIDIRESAEAEIDGVPARATLGRILQTEIGLQQDFEYRFAFVQKQAYVFAYFDLPEPAGQVKNPASFHDRKWQAKQRFFKSLQLPDISDRQKMNRQVEKIKETSFDIPANVLVLLALLLVAVGIVFWSYRSGK